MGQEKELRKDVSTKESTETMNFLLKKSYQVTIFPEALYSFLPSILEIRLMNPTLPSLPPPPSLVELFQDTNGTMTSSGFLNSIQKAQVI